MHTDRLLKKLEEQLQSYSRIPLEETSSIGLLDRYDTKYLMSYHQLLYVLKEASKFYLATTIDEAQVFPYRNLYFDTPCRCMYLAHHNGRNLRHKIRLREYEGFNLVFLEIKQKYKGRTTKRRLELTRGGTIETCLNDPEIIEEMEWFVIEESPYHMSDLTARTANRYHRITLVHGSREERITIDSLLHASFGTREYRNPDLVIAEIKHHGKRPSKEFARILKDHGIRPGGYSKYCIGTSMLEDSIKYNAFKETQLYTERIAYGCRNY